MQIFWVSGPVGKIKSLNLSFKTVVVGFAGLALGLLVTGSVLQFFGFRMALEYDPQIARRLGNLHTAVELESLNAVYHARLGELEAEHRNLVSQVSRLQSINTKLTEKLPAELSKNLPQRGAQGGAYLLPPTSTTASLESGSVFQRMDQFVKAKRGTTHWLAQDIKAWQSTLDWLDGLPVSLPVARDQASVSSSYGERIDPINRNRALHTGVDFELPTGTRVMAAGAGQVVEAGWDAQYGQTVVIEHLGGYASRYAHASELLVQKGQTVTAGQTIAKSGSTGRSTGPHLHFEVLKHGKFVDPAPFIFQVAGPR